MAVSNTNLRSPANGGYACNGSLVDFAGTFRLLDEADVLVVLTDSDGNLSELSLGAGDYTVAATGGTYPADSFTVTTASTYASGNTITLIRTMAYTQPSEYSDNGPFYPSNNEESYDRLCLQVQQLAEITDRCIKYESSTDTSGLTIVFDPDGSVLLSYLQPGSVTTSTIADSAVTYAKMQNVSATDKLLGRSTAGAGIIEEIACTAAGRALLDDANNTAQRTTLGLGTMATQAASAVAITGGTISNSGVLSVDSLYYIRDEKTSGTSGGNSTATTWGKRVLNTEVVANIVGASVASSVVTLPAGTYYFEGMCPVGSDATSYIAYHRCRLQNTSDATTVETGVSLNINDGGSPEAKVSGLFTIADSKNFELQHYRTDTRTNGYGSAVSDGAVEVYSELKIWKVG